MNCSFFSSHLFIKEYEQSSSISKKSKPIISENLSSTPSPDFIDKLLKHLDERSRNIIEKESLKTKF